MATPAPTTGKDKTNVFLYLAGAVVVLILLSRCSEMNFRFGATTTTPHPVRHEYAAWTEVLAPSVDTPWEFVGNEVVAPIHRRICLRENPHKHKYQWQCEDATDGWRDYAPGQCDNAQAFRFRSTTPESKLVGYEFRKSC